MEGEYEDDYEDEYESEYESEDDEDQIRDELNEEYLQIAKGSNFVAPLMFPNIDSYVTLSRDNTIVARVVLYPFDRDPGN
jgi:hypothetical protein